MLNNIQLEFCSCEFCTSKESLPFKTLGKWKLVQCPSCKLVYLNPRPTTDELSRMYSQEYYEYRQMQFDHSLHQVEREVAVRLPSAERLAREVGKTGCWFDIGCASGYLIAAARRLGWHVKGVEISTWSAEFARDGLGLDVLCGTLRDFEQKSGDNKFDLITAMAYLEHSSSPLNDLRIAAKLLKPGGLLVIKVPNLSSLDRLWHGSRWHGWHLPYHLYHFSPKTLCFALNAVNLSVQRIEQDFWNPKVHFREIRLGEGWRADHPDEGRAASQKLHHSDLGPSKLPVASSSLKDKVNPWLGRILSGRNMVVYARKPS
jgi:SAM-dependent methyltransferase